MSEEKLIRGLVYGVAAVGLTCRVFTLTRFFQIHSIIKKIQVLDATPPKPAV